MGGAVFITAILPLHLSLSVSPTDFVLKATAIYFIFELDDLDKMVMFWLQVEPPRTPASIKIDSRSRFEPKILSEEDDMGIEIRHYPRYSHAEFDTFSTMKIVMKERKPLQKSHTITQAKVNNSQKIQIVSIKQPVEELMATQSADDDVAAAVSYNHPAMWETNEQVVAVANLAHRNFDCTLFNPTASISKNLCHANLELQNELQNQGFDSVVDSGPSSSSSFSGSLSPSPSAEGEQVVVFVKYNNSNSPSGSGCGGEVWIYLDNDDMQLQKLLASSATAAAAASDNSIDDDAQSVDDHDNDDDQNDHNDDSYEKTVVTDNIVNNCRERNSFYSSSDLA
jgi:hypothetical protein